MVEAVDGALLTLGQEARRMIYQHAKKHGRFAPHDIPEHLADFNKSLKDLLGRESKLILDEMFARSLYHKLGLASKGRKNWVFADHVENAKKRLT